MSLKRTTFSESSSYSEEKQAASPRDSAPSMPENTENTKLFQRIWVVDDEIKILLLIFAFYSDKGLEHSSKIVFSADLDAIHSMMNKSLGLKFSKSQLVSKIRDLRIKFQIITTRHKYNPDFKFSNTQQQEIYELSKKIWCPDNSNEAHKISEKLVKRKGKSTLKVMKDQEVDIPEFMWNLLAKQAEHGDINWSLIKRGLNAYLHAIHSMMKKSLLLKFSKSQLCSKIRDHRMKFQIITTRHKYNTYFKFSNTQYQEIYELSKKIWCPDISNEGHKISEISLKRKGKSTLKVMNDQEVDIPEFMWNLLAKQAEHGDINRSLIK
ncbi:hypothetical protein J5N97_028336 [Dioscorea zingiberensis]|uniref:Glabrous enhancer-binding protein-like DBD domain-containing protein n=1 Tax=Dioscorea zingiberensis TaxID=325984 RepID=A0A9D5H4Q4_9LILI|nr:hypothetical protein J5N97_028336 [Dioscorea zingiberensis]